MISFDIFTVIHLLNLMIFGIKEKAIIFKKCNALLAIATNMYLRLLLCSRVTFDQGCGDELIRHDPS